LLEGLNQTEVNAKLGVDYHTLLGPLLRQDPDVIMLGEIRTKATAETALTAGITGHLVLSTVHAGNCFEVITRLRELGVSKQLISLSLKLIVAQRLIRTNCELCRIEAEISEKYLDFFKFPAGTILYTAKGCESCNFSGVSGRIGVFEFLPFTDQSRELLLRSSNDGLCSEFKELAYRAGYRPFSHGVREALLNGEISPHAALKTLGISPHFF
jgi:type II secretory ATPase GspE/PulE/Tfp pilus assembly ATPase PilB-like protein